MSKDGFGETDEAAETQHTHFAYFKFDIAEFEPERVWHKEFKIHPRIAKSAQTKHGNKDRKESAAVKRLRKKYGKVSITNRENMFLRVDSNRQNFYFFINRDDVKARSGWSNLDAPMFERKRTQFYFPSLNISRNQNISDVRFI